LLKEEKGLAAVDAPVERSHEGGGKPDRPAEAKTPPPSVLEKVRPEATVPPARRKISIPWSDYAAPALLILFFLFLWQAAVAVFDLPHYILPSPLRVFRTLGQAWDILLLHAVRTLIEVLVGFTVALAMGFGLAVLITYSAVLRRAIYPLVIASQTVPVIAIAPLLIVWFGYDMMPKVVMTALIAFFPVVVNTADGLEATDPDLLDLMRLLRASWWQTFRKIRFPSALPFVFSGMKIAAAVSVIGAVIGEWVGADKGLGFLMIRANAQLRTDLIFASIVVLSAMGIALFLAVAALEKISMPWERESE
jgi:ABC-type nitrate/sulfonate/bicarbonate transport system permease component